MTLLFPRVGDKRDGETFMMREFYFFFLKMCFLLLYFQNNPKHLLLEEFRLNRLADFGFSCPLT